MSRPSKSPHEHPGGHASAGYRAASALGRVLAALWRWRRYLLVKGAIAATSALLVAYLIGIVGSAPPTAWKYAVGSWCEGVRLPSFAILVEPRQNRTTIRVDGLNRSNPLDSADIHTVADAGCSSLELNGPGSMQHLFVTVGESVNGQPAMEQRRAPLAETDLCRNSEPESTVFVHVQRATPKQPNQLRVACHASGPELTGPLLTIGGEVPGAPSFIDFSRRGAYVTVSVLSASAAAAPSEVMKQYGPMSFWLLVPPEHTLLVQRTTPAPALAIPTSEGTLYKFDVSLLPFAAEGDLGNYFLVGALSFVYESDMRASVRDYLIFVLAAVFAFALERFTDSLFERKG